MVMQIIHVSDFADWRRQARHMLYSGTTPHQIEWRDQDEVQGTLFGASSPDVSVMPPMARGHTIAIPKSFMDLAQKVACHRDPLRWSYLYEALWRIAQGERHFMALSTDPLMHRLLLMQKSVTRDAHKMKAFVRFRKVSLRGAGEHESGTEDHYIAWHQPDHRVVRLVAPFFQRRFVVMQWSILTPDESVYWNGQDLHFGAGVPSSEAPPPDQLEDLWRTYYRAIFNPARIKLNMMRREMPVRHWKTLPETTIIPSLLQEAPQRVQDMLRFQDGFANTASALIRPGMDHQALADAAAQCRACPLHQCASRVVFGTGPIDAPVMIVGEQPGDQEDKHGLPFVGPAGEVLENALTEAGLRRDRLYLTNAVKHFKFTPKDGRRIHVTPSVHEMNACRPWLEAEIALVKPRLIIALGLTAARAVIGHGISMKEQRGQIMSVHIRGHACQAVASYHPSTLLRTPDEKHKTFLYNSLVHDIRLAKPFLAA